MSTGKEFALLFAVLFLPGMVAQGAGVDPRSFENVLYHVQLLAVAVPQVLLVVWVSDLRRTGSSKRFGWKKPNGGDLVVAFVGLVAIWAAVGAISLLAAALTGGEPIEPTVAWRFERLELIPIVLVSTLAIGYREEIFYRAYITDRAEEAGIDPRLALVAGSLLFGLGHLYQGLAGFFVSVAIGLVLAAVYLRTRSLHGIAAAHGAYNFLVLLASAQT